MNIPLFTRTGDERCGRRMIEVSEDFFAHWWTQSPDDEWRTFRCKEGLPDGARLLAVAHLPENGSFAFVFEHESFGKQRHGDRIPYIPVIFTERSNRNPPPLDTAEAEA